MFYDPGYRPTQQPTSPFHMGKGGTGGGSGYGYMPMQQPASPSMGKGGIGGLPDIRASLDAYKGYEPSAATKAFQAAHPGYAATTYAPGYQQEFERNFNAQQASNAQYNTQPVPLRPDMGKGNYYPGMGYLPEARNEIGPDFSDYFRGISLGEPPATGFTPERGGQSQPMPLYPERPPNPFAGQFDLSPERPPNPFADQFDSVGTDNEELAAIVKNPSTQIPQYETQPVFEGDYSAGAINSGATNQFQPITFGDKFTDFMKSPEYTSLIDRMRSNYDPENQYETRDFMPSRVFGDAYIGSSSRIRPYEKAYEDYQARLKGTDTPTQPTGSGLTMDPNLAKLLSRPRVDRFPQQFRPQQFPFMGGGYGMPFGGMPFGGMPFYGGMMQPSPFYGGLGGFLGGGFGGGFGGGPMYGGFRRRFAPRQTYMPYDPYMGYDRQPQPEYTPPTQESMTPLLEEFTKFYTDDFRKRNPCKI